MQHDLTLSSPSSSSSAETSLYAALVDCCFCCHFLKDDFSGDGSAALFSSSYSFFTSSLINSAAGLVLSTDFLGESRDREYYDEQRSPRRRRRRLRSSDSVALQLILGKTSLSICSINKSRKGQQKIPIHAAACFFFPPPLSQPFFRTKLFSFLAPGGMFSFFTQSQTR